MRIMTLALCTALLTAPAFAQGPGQVLPPAAMGQPVLFGKNVRPDDPSRIGNAAPSNFPIQHLGKPFDVHQTPSAVAFNGMKRSERKAVQSALQRFGYAPGPVDGLWGPRSYTAFKAWAADAGWSDRLGTIDGAWRAMLDLTS